MIIFILNPKFTRGLFLIIFFSLLLFSINTKSYSQGYTENDIRIFSEAVGEIEQKALLPKSRREIIRGALRAYLKNLDKFSDCLSPEEYSAFKRLQSGQYVGLGMDIEKDTSGEFICFSYPNTPAYDAGIRSGDILVAVDGMDISGKTVFQIAAKAMGEKGSKVSVKIKRKNGRQQNISVIRDIVISKTVDLEKKDGFSLLHIFRFAPSTPREIKLALGDIGDEIIIIDLRGNPGGDLHAAIDSAMLFLEKEKKIVDVVSRIADSSYTVTSSPINATSPLYIWQDEYTASAAEVFAAALVQNNRSESIGKKTFGKGVQQEIIELSDGAALFLTTAYLRTPNGLIYHEIGLRPTYPVKADTPDISAYMSKMKQVISDGPLVPTPTDKSRPVKEPDLPPAERQKRSPVPAASPRPLENPSDKDQSEAVEPENLQENSCFVCFQENFDTKKEAEVWSLIIRNSIKTYESVRQFQRRTSDGVKFIVCLGPYRNREIAEKRRIHISEAINADMFIKYSNGNAVDSDEPPLIESDDRTSWSIQVGAYEQYESVMAAIDRIRTKDKEKRFSLWVKLSYSGSDPPLFDKEKFEDYDVDVRMTKVSEADIGYKLFIGPYHSKEESLLDLLKQGGLVKEEAYWMQIDP